MAEKTIATNGQEQAHGGGRELTRTQEQFVRPAVDIFETPDGLTVLADLPGARKEDVELDVENDVLTIKARAKHSLPVEPIYREFELVSYYRQFQLADTVDDEKIGAEFKHGVLTLRIPRAEKTKPRQIPVTVS